MSTSDLLNSVDQYWEEKIVPTLMEYIEIPAKSPAFDTHWAENGFIDQALELVEKWIEDRNIPGLKKQVLRADGRTPLLLLELKGELDYEVLMYGHLDKQPEMTGWDDDLAPWKAVRKSEKLYGRGGADDGYAVFASLCAVEYLLDAGTPKPNIKIAIEFSEESGSEDLPFYFENFGEKFGDPKLVICLDSGAGNYDQMWSTTSLRGLVSGVLKVDVLDEGVHSGDASGIVPSSFRVAREILNRLEDPTTGKILPTEFQSDIPSERIGQAERAAATLNENTYKKFPFAGTTGPMSDSHVELILNRTWRAALSVTGSEGMPEIASAGNVLLPYTSLKLSLRLPPTVDAKTAAVDLKNLLEKDPPYDAKVEFQLEDAASGWNAPPVSEKLETLLQEASNNYYEKEALTMGEGGSIPFMGMIGDAFPEAQFVITGVLGPNSNAHGPNEFIHIEYAKKLTACMFHVLNNIQKL